MMKDAIFKGGQNGLRIKSWARPSHRFVQGVQFLDVVMLNVQNPIVIDQNYCPHNLNCPGQASGVKVSDVLFQNIQGTSGTANPCSRITLENVSLTCKKQVGQSCCNNAIGKTSGLVHPTSCL
ncbi:polygalacturonase-like [Pyrus ussuriensis x Pyrus communis]|uniref:Polygalacturonase-like n=1 Tax=Pyrus ussuriensis x Pyrus communis TaxID=2448454 RepID=A0A5N5HW73_9ROSA|nr:polygalacturonase-like [Pyrus ussuriensis x Pyrus communis]